MFRLNELLQGDGIAIIEKGLNFGGGLLYKYGINSNTSGGGFLKCTFKKSKEKYDKEQKNRNAKIQKAKKLDDKM